MCVQSWPYSGGHPVVPSLSPWRPSVLHFEEFLSCFGSLRRASRDGRKMSMASGRRVSPIPTHCTFIVCHTRALWSRRTVRSNARGTDLKG